MRIEIHELQNTRIAEVISADVFITDLESGLDLLASVYYQDVDKIILHQKNILPAFFDLKTGIAGEVLQKFSNYRVRLVIVGDFSSYKSKSLQDFIFESNKGIQVNFVGSTAEAIERFLKIS